MRERMNPFKLSEENDPESFDDPETEWEIDDPNSWREFSESEEE